MKLVITLDGPAGSGKSTLAKYLADKYPLNQVDSGALYRSYTWLALEFARQQGLPFDQVSSSPEFLRSLQTADLQISFHDKKQVIEINGHNAEKVIRSPEITAHIKHIADNPAIRQLVNDKLRQIASLYHIVADGRDMGTEVFPGARHKFFVTASPETRARRRYEELAPLHQISYQEVLAQVIERDQNDTERKYGGLRPADDAILIDTTGLKINGAIEIIEGFIQKSILEIS